MSKIVSFINMKGGVGKTTLAVNLAALATIGNKKTLLVDLDPQANASIYLMGADGYRQFLESNDGNICDIFEQFTPSIRTTREKVDSKNIIHTIKTWGFHKVDLIPSRLELSWTLKNPASKENLLSRFLVNECADYQLIVIDCPPTESMFTTAAYLSSDFILIPVVPEFLSTIGLPLLIRSINEFREQYENNKLQIAGILFNYPTKDYPEEHKKSKEYVMELALEENWHVFNSNINYSRSYPKGSRARSSIFRTGSAHYVRKQEFKTFAKDLFERIGL